MNGLDARSSRPTRTSDGEPQHTDNRSTRVQTALALRRPDSDRVGGDAPPEGRLAVGRRGIRDIHRLRVRADLRADRRCERAATAAPAELDAGAGRIAASRG